MSEIFEKILCDENIRLAQKEVYAIVDCKNPIGNASKSPKQHQE